MVLVSLNPIYMNGYNIMKKAPSVCVFKPSTQGRVAREPHRMRLFSQSSQGVCAQCNPSAQKIQRTRPESQSRSPGKSDVLSSVSDVVVYQSRVSNHLPPITSNIPKSKSPSKRKKTESVQASLRSCCRVVELSCQPSPGPPHHCAPCA